MEVWFNKTFPNWQNQVDFNNDGSMSFVAKNDEQKKSDAPAAVIPAPVAETTPAIAPVDAETAVDAAA